MKFKSLLLTSSGVLLAMPLMTFAMNIVNNSSNTIYAFNGKKYTPQMSIKNGASASLPKSFFDGDEMWLTLETAPNKPSDHVSVVLLLLLPQ